jgi:diadenosine tetraphosphate (Ap4A) HIT family hydrolase
MRFERIDLQLLTDCHYFGVLSACDVLLHRNSSVPWFILVPDTELDDVLDLPEAQLQQVMAECAAVSALIKQELGFTKINFAGLGNVVSQMHLHIIGRRASDGCWPQPVWGALPEGGDYSMEELNQWQVKMVERLDLSPAPL